MVDISLVQSAWAGHPLLRRKRISIRPMHTQGSPQYDLGSPLHRHSGGDFGRLPRWERHPNDGSLDVRRTILVFLCNTLDHYIEVLGIHRSLHIPQPLSLRPSYILRLYIPQQCIFSPPPSHSI